VTVSRSPFSSGKAWRIIFRWRTGLAVDGAKKEKTAYQEAARAAFARRTISLRLGSLAFLAP
jgi:hypothetical protein